MPKRRTRIRRTAFFILVVLTAAACTPARPQLEAVGADPTPEPTPTALTIPQDPPPTETPEDNTSEVLTEAEEVTSPDGRVAPIVPDDPEAVALMLAAAEQALRSEGTAIEDLADVGHLQQVIYRRWGSRPEWDETIFAALPTEITPAVELGLAARREFIAMPTGTGPATDIPAWEIIEPEDPDALLSYYQEASAASGIDWQYLAAINLVETGMGRIRGLSTAGAQGPMQFIPTTWSEIGEGDINDPRDSILAAARLLDQRGGPENMAAALAGYNNSEFYVRAVQAYADILAAEPATFAGFYNWEIHFFTEQGDLWLPVGTLNETAVPVDEYLAQAPWSAPR